MLQVFLVWLAVDGILLTLLVLFQGEGVATDSERLIYELVHYGIGFPLVYLDRGFPYFLESAQLPAVLIPLMLLNYFLKTLPFLLARAWVEGRKGGAAA